MNKVIFNFHKAKGIAGKAIRFATRTQRFNHVSIELNGKTYEAKMSPFKGVYCFDGTYEGAYDEDEWELSQYSKVLKVSLAITKEEEKAIYSFLSRVSARKRKKILGLEFELPVTPYDYLSLVGFIANKDIEDIKAIYCSELGNMVAELIWGVKISRKTNLSPDDFYLMLKYYKAGLKDA